MKEKILTRNLRFPEGLLPSGMTATNAEPWLKDIDVIYDDVTDEYIIKRNGLVSAGAADAPVYFDEEGQPQTISYTISANVPSDAKFTDTTYTVTAPIILTDTTIGLDTITPTIIDNPADVEVLSYGEEFQAVDTVSVDAYGRLTGLTIKHYQAPNPLISVGETEPEDEETLIWIDPVPAYHVETTSMTAETFREYGLGILTPINYETLVRATFSCNGNELVFNAKEALTTPYSYEVDSETGDWTYTEGGVTPTELIYTWDAHYNGSGETILGYYIPSTIAYNVAVGSVGKLLGITNDADVIECTYVFAKTP